MISDSCGISPGSFWLVTPDPGDIEPPIEAKKNLHDVFATWLEASLF